MRRLLQHIVWVSGVHRVPVLIIGMAGICLLWFTVSGHRMTTNPRSRLITVERLLDAGTWVHSSPEDSSRLAPSIDAVMVGNRRYSSKPPNYPLLMFLEAMPLKWVTGWNFVDKQVHFVRYLVVLNQVLPYLLMLWMALIFGREFTKNNWTLSFLLLAMSFGLLPFGYAVTINNHSVSGALFFLAFYLAYSILFQGKRERLRFAALGLILGFAASIELPGLVFAGIMGGWILLRHPKQAMLAILGGLLPFVVQSVVMYSISGSIKPFYLQGSLYYFEGSYWLNPISHDLSREPKWLYGFHMLLGHHGVFSLSPVLGLGLGGAIMWLKDKGVKGRWFFGSVLVGMFLVTLYILLRTYNYGGWCIGMRWLLHFMPILMFMGIPLLERMRKSVGGKLLFVLLLLISVLPVAQALYKEAFVLSWHELWWISLFG